MAALRVAFLSAFALELIATLSVALIAVEIGLRLASGGLALVTALVVLLLTPECYLPLRRVGAGFHAAQSGLDASDDLHDLLERPVMPVGHLDAPTSGPMLLRGVDLVRRDRTVLADIDVDVTPGSIVAVYGPTGIGKSTLIDACRGRLLRPTRRHHGRRNRSIAISIPNRGPTNWLSSGSARPPSEPPSPTTYAGRRRPPMISSPPHSTTSTSPGSGSRRTDELSGGQLRRVQVAAALVAVRAGRARFVLADEPTAHLDADNAQRVWHAIGRLARVNGAAVLVATHDARCRAVADHVIELGGAIEPPAQPPARPDPTVHAAYTLSAPASRAEPDRTDSDTEWPSPTRKELRTATRRVMQMARPARRRFAGATLLGALAEVCTLGLAAVAAWLIVKASEQPDLAELSLAILAVRTFGIGKGVFRYGERLATHDAGLRSLSEIRAGVVDRLADIAPAGIPGWERGDVLQRVVNDVDRLLDLFVRVLGPVLAVAATAAAAALITIVLDPAAGLVLLVALVIVGVALPAVTVARESSIGPLMAERRARLAGRALSYTESLDALIAHRIERAARRSVESAGERTGCAVDPADSAALRYCRRRCRSPPRHDDRDAGRDRPVGDIDLPDLSSAFWCSGRWPSWNSWAP